MTVTTLQVGKHSAHSGEVCLLEAVSVLAGEDFSDTPETACPVLASFGRALNDAMPDETRSLLLLPLIPLLVGTRDPAKEQARAFVFADRAVRLFASIALDAAGLTEPAHTLRCLPSIVDTETAWAAAEVAESAEVAEAAAESAESAEAARAASTATSEAARAARAASTATSEAARAVIAESAAWAAWAARDWQVAVAVFREAIAL